jgi:hypothetical protein
MRGIVLAQEVDRAEMQDGAAAWPGDAAAPAVWEVRRPGSDGRATRALAHDLVLQ